jgi:hypothetical protein
MRANRRGRAPKQAGSLPATNGEADRPTVWSWREGVVDIQGEHIELRYGDAEKSGYEQWVPVALIGKPTNHVFPVSWLISSDDPSYAAIIDAAEKELDFYLLAKT